MTVNHAEAPQEGRQQQGLDGGGEQEDQLTGITMQQQDPATDAATMHTILQDQEVCGWLHGIFPAKGIEDLQRLI